jgi:hypothetical protein
MVVGLRTLRISRALLESQSHSLRTLLVEVNHGVATNVREQRFVARGDSPPQIVPSAIVMPLAGTSCYVFGGSSGFCKEIAVQVTPACSCAS